MNSAVQITMQCSNVRGDFCSSPCYATLAPFLAQCQDQMTPTLTMMLSSAMGMAGSCGTVLQAAVPGIDSFFSLCETTQGGGH